MIGQNRVYLLHPTTSVHTPYNSHLIHSYHHVISQAQSPTSSWSLCHDNIELSCADRISCSILVKFCFSSNLKRYSFGGGIELYSAIFTRLRTMLTIGIATNRLNQLPCPSKDGQTWPCYYDTFVQFRVLIERLSHAVLDATSRWQGYYHETKIATVSRRVISEDHATTTTVLYLN